LFVLANFWFFVKFFLLTSTHHKLSSCQVISAFSQFSEGFCSPLSGNSLSVCGDPPWKVWYLAGIFLCLLTLNSIMEVSFSSHEDFLYLGGNSSHFSCFQLNIHMLP
jgi:hypothetical protein